MCVHPKTKAKFKTKLKGLTSRSNGWGYEKRKEKLTYAIRGWISYFRLAEMRSFLKETDEWLRSRIRMSSGNAGNEYGHASRTYNVVA